ncbi:MAG: hypothetical protein B1H11_10065 [Desulfobacteraceae bacterium 4484_190.1]|nr:MAG: hypothetical protein B1H11_10065 [Desulfobacteraceae bacterium 4484_190.1]
MAKINEEMKTLLNEVPICVFATADENGIPNAVPIHYSKIMDDSKIMLVDNFMKKTLHNINANPNVSISVWKGKTGYQFKGRASVETSGANFDLGKEMVLKNNPKGNPKGVVIIDIDSIYITSPGPEAGNKVE